MKIFVTGGTGLVGSRLVKALRARDDEPVVLTRRPDAVRQELGGLAEIVAGDPMQEGDWMDRVADCSAVVHLAGEGIFNRRWSASFKDLLRTSRIRSTENVVKALARQPRTADGKPKVLVHASAIGYYGPTGEEKLTEASPAGCDFLAQVCIDWEKAAQAAAGVRVAIIRVGVVLDPRGGALKKMLPPFKMFVGGPIGSGTQYVSWIHHEDLVGLILLALDRAEATGPLNGTAPNPVTNKEFSRALGRALHRPGFFWTPGFMLRLALGEVAGIITQGQRVMPQKALDLGYAFRFADIDAALADLFAK